ncbi:MAG: bifunctional UDP-sugar hydrolase/5'-nucleotidase [Candidatus Latescibacterota bacterium]
MKILVFRMGIAALGIVLAGFAPACPAAGVELTVIYTANSSGKLNACSCPGDPYGGLAERVTLLKKLRAGEKQVLLLDAGNMVSLFGDFDDRAACVMRLMNLMGYAAAGVGRQELFNNTRGAVAMSKVAKFPFLAASIKRGSDAKPVFRPFTMAKMGKTTVGIIGMADSSCYFPEINREFDYTVVPFEKALPPLLKELEGKTDFIVVLSQMEVAKSEQLLRLFPSVDLVIQGYGNRELETPKRISRGFLVAPGDRGQFVGVIRLEKTPGGSAGLKKSELVPVLEIEEDRKAMDIIRNYYRKRK